MNRRDHLLASWHAACGLAALRHELAAVTAQGGLHVWVTHMFVQDTLTGHSTASGEGLLIQHRADDQAAVLETWTFN